MSSNAFPIPCHFFKILTIRQGITCELGPKFLRQTTIQQKGITHIFTKCCIKLGLFIYRKFTNKLSLQLTLKCKLNKTKLNYFFCADIIIIFPIYSVRELLTNNFYIIVNTNKCCLKQNFVSYQRDTKCDYPDIRKYSV